MFSYDPFTLTGVQSTIKFSTHWQIEFALHGGNDMSIWTNSSSVNRQVFVRWVSNDNKDGIWAGINSLGTNWKYRNGHDNLQMVAGTWGHKFNERVHMMTEAYYEWERDVATGGSASYGTVRYGAGGEPGVIIPGISGAVGVVNYFQVLVGNKYKNYISVRNDYLNDLDGWRTGYKTTYISHTIGFIHYFTPWLFVRPEIRYDYNVGGNNITPYDLGTKKNQFTAASDFILRF
jgi:hypothetical protein